MKSKPGQEGKSKYRGEIEIRVAFTVKSGSLLDLSKKDKHKGSLGQISQAAHSIGRFDCFFNADCARLFCYCGLWHAILFVIYDACRRKSNEPWQQG